MSNAQEQVEVIERFAADIHSKAELVKKLESGRPLRIKYGIDPTAADVHLGHTVPLRLLKALQKFGHRPCIVIGNATAIVGDPSGRDETRTAMDWQTINQNADRYLDQIKKIINLDAAEVSYNNDWFCDMQFHDVLDMLRNFTVQQILERDDFKKRLASSTPISMHELMYPLMQGQDSVEVEADIEIGGTEQLFNMMIGRDLQRIANQEPQVVITLPILRGTDGKRRMGKSLDNYVGIGESPFDIYSKVMSVPDELVREWFVLLTDKPEDVIDSTLIIHHPMNAKKILARRIVMQYYDEERALVAEALWTQQFSKKEIPDKVEEVFLPKGDLAPEVRLIVLLRDMGLAESMNDARRLITQGAVSMFFPEDSKNSQKPPKDDVEFHIKPADGLVIRVGRKIRKLKVV